MSQQIILLSLANLTLWFTTIIVNRTAIYPEHTAKAMLILLIIALGLTIAALVSAIMGW
jgi:hypothetical protein